MGRGGSAGGREGRGGAAGDVKFQHRRMFFHALNLIERIFRATTRRPLRGRSVQLPTVKFAFLTRSVDSYLGQ